MMAGGENRKNQCSAKRGGGPVLPCPSPRSHPQQQLALIRLGSRVLLVGTTPSGMSTLATIDHPAEVEELLKELQSGKSAPRPTWKDLFTPAVDAEFRRQPVDSVNVSTLRPGSRAPVDADPVRPARPQTVEVTDV